MSPVTAPGTLAEELEQAAADLDAERRQLPDGSVEWAVRNRVFATFEGGGASFRLADPVTAAAIRTPDTSASPRGPDWVVFRPAALDRHAIDRLTAWLASAWRRADGES